MPIGEWNREKIKRYLLESTCNDILNSNFHLDEHIEDSIIWNSPTEADFSVKSTYNDLTKEIQSITECHWELIWRWPGNQRNKTFLCLCAKNKILTNVHKVKRNLTSNPLCPIYRMEEESVLHALRDCPASKVVWKILIKLSNWSKFFSGNIIN